MIVIATGFVPLSPLFVFFRQWLFGKTACGLERILCGVLVKELKESMNRCTGHCDILKAEILFKTALNTIQSINQLLTVKESNHNVFDCSHFILDFDGVEQTLWTREKATYRLYDVFLQGL